MLKDYLKENNMSIYRLSKNTGIAYSTLNYIATGKTKIENVEFGNITKIKNELNVSYEDILELCKEYTLQDFETFKSSICHEVKQKGNAQFIIDIISSNDVEHLWKICRKEEALYLIGMVDYLSRLEEVDRCNKYDIYRNYKMDPLMFPLGMKIQNKNTIPENAIPEFLERGIVEGDVFNVA